VQVSQGRLDLSVLTEPGHCDALKRIISHIIFLIHAHYYSACPLLFCAYKESSLFQKDPALLFTAAILNSQAINRNKMIHYAYSKNSI
ncbi:hypothetical protein, partial [Photobacterium halotolerans]|uniref:hypothetical protein n=1 Tax=Photobacterium halotolerans TaxID=265726 RepID=UPI001F21B93F